MYSITVLMSTYNGHNYLREQLDSILNQINVRVEIVIRDDGSTDDTKRIIRDYMSKYENIKLIDDNVNLGACKSFLKLMSVGYDTDYIALADQDDIWDSDKLECAVNMMDKKKQNVPMLYYSNLRIVDENNKFCRLSHSKPYEPTAKYSYLAEGLPTGCTIVYNQELSKLLYNKIPEKCVMHDTWLFLVASAFGTCIYDFEPHINYRQHSSNVVGTSKKRFKFSSIRREFKYIFDRKTQPRFTNAKAFYQVYSNEVDKETQKKLENFVNYKKSIRNTIKVLLDSDLNSGSLYRRIRFKIMVCLHNM